MATELKFICLNLWLGGKLREGISSFLQKEQADIVVVQEAWELPGQRVADLAASFGYSNCSFAPQFQFVAEEGGQQVGNAVWSRFPLTPQETIWYDVPYDGNFKEVKGDYTHLPRNLQHCIADVHGTPLHVFNTQGIWGFDGSDNPRRLAMGKAIAQAVAGVAPAVLAGDFNVQEKTATISQIEEKMTSVFKGELKTSFNLRHKTDGGFAAAVVDMIFVSPDIAVSEHHTTDEDVTDHVPLVATLSIK